MDRLFGGISTPEGVAGAALVMALVLILAKPVRKAIAGGDDPVIERLGALTGAMRDNAAASKAQLEQFRTNNEIFGKVATDLAAIRADIAAIKTSVDRELARQQGEREARR